MSKQTIVDINGTKYIIDAFKGLEGWTYLPKVTKFVLPFIFGNVQQEEGGKSTIEKIKDGDIDQEAVDSLDEEKVVKVLMDLLSGENAKEIIDLVPELLKRVTKNGVSIDFDEEFSQNYLTMFKLVFEVLKLNYLKSFPKLDTK